jgi:hypothetical protein
MLPKVVMSVLTYRLTATIWKEPEGMLPGVPSSE